MIGCTLHTIPNSGIDTGEIIELAKMDVNFEKSLFWNIVQLYPLGAELIIKTLNKIANTTSFNTQKQNPQAGNYFSIPTKNDFEAIESIGMEIISAKDYQDVLTNFILQEIPEIEKQSLKRFIASFY